MKILKTIFLFLILFSLVNSVNSAEVAIKSSPVQDVILPGQVAIFDVEITNLGPKGEIKAILTDFNWRKESNYGFYTIESGKTIKDVFRLSPIGNIAPGIYSINLRIYPTANPENYVDNSFIVSVVQYKDLVDAKLEYNPQGLSPNKENLITLKLKNRNAVDLKDVDVKLIGEILNKEIKTDLGKEETKDFPFNLKLENIREGDYETNIIALYNNNIISNVTASIKVASYLDIKETKKEEFSFLIKTTEIIRDNSGNTVSKEVYSKTLTSFERLFTKTSPEPNSIEKLDGSYKYNWEFTLNPSDSYFILIKINYGIPIIIIILIGLLTYFIYTRANAGLTLTKKILLLKSKEGNIIGLKVLLILRNSGQTLKGLKLTDNIPGLLELPHEYGTLKPSSTKSGVAGSVVTWDIAEVLKGEERVISYKMKSRVNNVGKLTIPRATCRYKDNLGRIYLAKSNMFNLF